MLFVPKDKPLLTNKGNKSLNIRHPRLIHVITLSAALPLAPIMLPSYQNLNFQNLGIYFFAWTILCYVCLLFFTCLTFKLAILFQLTSNTTSSSMYLSPAILAEDGISAYAFSANSTRKLVFLSNTSNIFTANLCFCLFNICSQPF